MRSIATFIAMLALAAVQAAAAQEIPTRVGRLAFTEGQVSVYQDPELGWDKAYVNTPITSENSVWTDRGSRAEMRVGGIAARLDQETQLDISRLEENDFDAGVPRGSLNLRVRYKEQDDHITLNTPHALFVIETDGRYRLDVDEDRDQSRLTVLGGYAFLEGPNGRIPVENGRMVIVSGGGQYAFERAREDAFDRWASSRDQTWQDSVARRYVPSDMTGYEELDRYGQWQQDADYGAVWYPTRVSSGWAPYRYGHWSYLRPWGWTWIDDAPWGYAPSHYGRWIEVNNRWGWVPGYAPSQRVAWAPALVGFFGGAGFSVSISSGSPVGWYPLAPWERYDPWYRVSPTYVTRVNRYVVDRRPRWWQGRGDDWRHWNRDRAYTVVNRDVFVNRRAVQNATVRVNAETIRRAPQLSNQQVVQQVLPQRSDVVRYRESNRTNVAAPTISMRRSRESSVQQNNPVVRGEPAQAQVVQPQFQRRGQGRVAAPAAVGTQPTVSAPAPQQAQPQQVPQNPTARGEPRQGDERARRGEAQQQQERERAARETAQRQQQGEAAQRAQQEQAQRAQQEQAQRAAREAQQQQERSARESAQQQQQQAREEQRRQQEAQRAAQEQQRAQQQQQQRAQQQQQRAAQEQQRAAQEQQRQQREAQQRAAQEQQRQQREAQQQQQRAAQEQQRQQREAQQQQQRAAQEQQRQQREAQQPQQQQQRAAPEPQRAAPEPTRAPQANPTGRGESRGRGQEQRENKGKDKDKDKD
jgi:hypothetical protein